MGLQFFDTLFLTFRYGGPGSQLVNARYERDWNYILPNNYQYIVVIVDGRGTGFKGRKLRNPVKNNLGFWEVRDQINAAKYAPYLVIFLAPVHRLLQNMGC
jgi:dipeptidyl aminopeptidase/acylaminoacyl peptidase